MSSSSQGNAVRIERIARFLRTPDGPHCAILREKFRYMHSTQERKPGRAPRFVQHEVKLFAEDNGLLYFPCGLQERCMSLLTQAGFAPALHDLRKPCSALQVPSTRNLAGLRPGQQEVIDAIVQADNGIVEALTGFGKGVVIDRLVSLYPKARHLIVTKSKSVANMLHQRLKANHPQAGVWNSDKHVQGNPMVCTSGSLGGLELDKFDFVQLDEVHELLTPSFLDYYPLFGGCKLISYSASPDQRLDNTKLAMEAYFGTKVCKVDYQEGVDLGLVVPIEVWRVDWGCTPADAMRGIKSDVRRMRLAYWNNVARNTAIARVVQEEVPARLSDPDPQILILVDKVEHALRLAQLLPDFKAVYGEVDAENAKYFQDQGLLPDGKPVSRKEVERIRQDFSSGKVRRAIATGIWSTGVDFPQLQVLVRADGGNSPIKDTQMPGRVCRIADGKSKGIQVDFADRFDAWTASRSRSRFKRYEEKKWTTVEIDLRQA
jgi:superfamily II DNA or RNA helicase